MYDTTVLLNVFLAVGTGFMEDNFSTDQDRGWLG